MLKEFLNNISKRIDQEERINDLEEKLSNLEKVCLALIEANDESLRCLQLIEQVLIQNNLIVKVEAEDLN